MTHQQSETGKLAGIDYGTVRIGVAVTDPDRMMAFPHENYTRKNETKDAAFFRNLVVQEQIVRFVVGLPLHLSGDFSEKAHEAMAFGKWLTKLTGLPVDYCDERYTSVEAERYLLAENLSRKKRKQKLDKVAAQILLTSYLESGCRNINEYLPLED
ncbi:MAG: Holliday junction resolvase RuvX [Planctomycetaceae bacterium]|jgi:putative Holliday junction resolvase|nr:Holliday junction resolvase RuvX [Planctomycetaceae bacterium]